MREKVLLICAECLSRNYSSMIRKDDTRRELKKYCPKCGKQTIHRISK